MKLNDFKDVEELVKQRDRIIKAMGELEESAGRIEKDFSCYVSLHADGSGKIVNLTGCYVCGDVIDVVERVLVEKLARVENQLSSYGVEVD